LLTREEVFMKCRMYHMCAGDFLCIEDKPRPKLKCYGAKLNRTCFNRVVRFNQHLIVLLRPEI
jgi:hypothetical protein